MYKIYKVTTNEGKIYIGCTSRPIHKRMIEHKSSKKHFVDFKHVEILATTENFEKSQILESYYIEKFDSSNPQIGLNKRLGGNNFSFADWVLIGFGKNNKASRPKELNGMYGKKHSEETKEKIKMKAIGRKFSDETRLKKSEKMKIYWANKKKT